jgi:hypothetical protein
MADQRPKFPESLAHPIEIGKGVRVVRLSSADLSTAEAIENLVSDLYWHADDLYYLFFKHGEGIAPALLRRLESYDITSETTQFYFFRHPHPIDEIDFVRVLPGEAQLEWQQKAAAGQMHGRITLGLAPWRKKKLDLAYAAEATASAIANHEPTIELKPNFSGIGINLHSALRRFKAWWGEQQRSNDRVE